MEQPLTPNSLQAVALNAIVTGLESMERAMRELEAARVRLLAEAFELAAIEGEYIGQVAVKRGPIVYCLESVDLPTGVRPLDVLIPPDINLRARFDQRLLGGVAVLEGTGLARRNSQWNGQLYRELSQAALTPIKLRLIPYSVWANRGAGEMSVWLPLACR